MDALDLFDDEDDFVNSPVVNVNVTTTSPTGTIATDNSDPNGTNNTSIVASNSVIDTSGLFDGEDDFAGSTTINNTAIKYANDPSDTLPIFSDSVPPGTSTSNYEPMDTSEITTNVSNDNTVVVPTSTNASDQSPGEMDIDEPFGSLSGTQKQQKKEQDKERKQKQEQESKQVSEPEKGPEKMVLNDDDDDDDDDDVLNQLREDVISPDNTNSTIKIPAQVNDPLATKVEEHGSDKLITENNESGDDYDFVDDSGTDDDYQERNRKRVKTSTFTDITATKSTTEDMGSQTGEEIDEGTDEDPFGNVRIFLPKSGLVDNNEPNTGREDKTPLDTLNPLNTIITQGNVPSVMDAYERDGDKLTNLPAKIDEGDDDDDFYYAQQRRRNRLDTTIYPVVPVVTDTQTTPNIQEQSEEESDGDPFSGLQIFTIDTARISDNIIVTPLVVNTNGDASQSDSSGAPQSDSGERRQRNNLPTATTTTNTTTPNDTVATGGVTPSNTDKTSEITEKVTEPKETDAQQVNEVDGETELNGWDLEIFRYLSPSNILNIVQFSSIESDESLEFEELDTRINTGKRSAGRRPSHKERQAKFSKRN